VPSRRIRESSRFGEPIRTGMGLPFRPVPERRARVAVVIVNLNGGELVRRTVDSLRAQTHAPARVIVVDNASTDGSEDGLDELYPGLKLVRSSGTSASRLRTTSPSAAPPTASGSRS
jgi:Glycosyl transferase family 2